MGHGRLASLLLAATVFAATVAAQDTPIPTASMLVAQAEFVVPVHRQDGDPRLPAWTAGPGFKARFAGGITFYPRVPEDAPGHLPLQWTTVSVRVGGTDLIGGRSATESISDNRFTIRRGDVIEAYDLRRAGVEQSFTLLRRPRGIGDVVVVGVVTTSLTAREVDGEHASLTFEDSRGRAIVEYGRAIAYDAKGLRTTVQTSYDGERITLRLEGSWVARAAFPLTIDPLLAPKILSTGNHPNSITTLEIGRETESAKQNTIVFFRRTVKVGSNLEVDAYAVQCDSDFGNAKLVFADITTGSSNNPDSTCVAPVAGVNKWILAYLRAGQIRYHSRTFASVAFSAASTAVAVPVGVSPKSVDVGGTASFSPGTRALLTYNARQARPSLEWTGAVLLDASTAVVGRHLKVGGTHAVSTALTNPVSVNQASLGGSSSWILTWVNPTSRRVNISRVTAVGSVMAAVAVGSTGSIQNFRPRVAGRGGRYMVGYDRFKNPRSMEFHRFDWLERSTTPILKQVSTLASRGPVALEGLAFDNRSKSHWAVLNWDHSSVPSKLWVRRVTGDGTVLESAMVYQKVVGTTLQDLAGDIADLDNSVCFPLAYGRWTGRQEIVEGRGLCYISRILNVPYGVGCGGRISANIIPLPGTESFRISLDAAPANVLGFLTIGLARDAFDLKLIGIPGCFINQKITALNLPARTSASGSAGFTLPLPSNLAVNFYSQWIFQDPKATTPLKFATTRGLASTVK